MTDDEYLEAKVIGDLAHFWSSLSKDAQAMAFGYIEEAKRLCSKPQEPAHD